MSEKEALLKSLAEIIPREDRTRLAQMVIAGKPLIEIQAKTGILVGQLGRYVREDWSRRMVPAPKVCAKFLKYLLQENPDLVFAFLSEIHEKIGRWIRMLRYLSR